MNLFLQVSTGALWTVAYIDCIRIGFKDKAYAMPLWALSLNIGWEFVYSLLGYVQGPPTLQTYINTVWFCFDVVILITYFRFGVRFFPTHLKKYSFYVWGVLAIVTSLAIQYVFMAEFRPHANAEVYSSYPQNALMSVLFIVMLTNRKSSIGQTKLIAYTKFLGTFAATIELGILGGAAPFGGRPSMFVLVFGAICALFDILYIIMLTRLQRGERTAYTLAK